MQKFTSTNPRLVFIRLTAQETAAWEAESTLPQSVPRFFQDLVKKEAKTWAAIVAAQRKRQIHEAIIEGPDYGLLRVFIPRPIKQRRA